jgi:hypothetical protein
VETWITPKARKGVTSGIAGRGLVAAEPIARDEVVAVKAGHIVTTAVLQSLPEHLQARWNATAAASDAAGSSTDATGSDRSCENGTAGTSPGTSNAGSSGTALHSRVPVGHEHRDVVPGGSVAHEGAHHRGARVIGQ